MGKIEIKTFNPLADNAISGAKVPSLLDTSIESGSRKNILLIKVPYCVHHESSIFNDGEEPEDVKVKEHIKKDQQTQHKDFKTKTPFRPIPSLAIAALTSFFEKYKSYDYNLKCIDINLLVYDNKKPGENIDTKKYVKIIEDTLAKENYDILAISAMFVMSQRWVTDTLKFSKKYHPDAKIIIGGGYPTIYPEYCLKKHEIDLSVVGEGDDTFLHAVNRLNNIVDDKFEKRFPFEGYAAKDKLGKIFFVPRKKGFLDLNELPPASYKWLNVKDYFKKSGNSMLPLEASRGCPYGCTYCNTFISWGRKVRYKTVDNLIKEISDLQSNYHRPQLHFVDDNLSFDRKWTIEFLDKLAEKNLKLHVTCSNFHYKRLDEEILDKLFKVGVNEIAIALESGSPSVNKRIHRVLDWKKAKRIVDHTRKRKKSSTCFWMVGFPNETMDELNETFKLAKDIKSTRNLFSIVMPYPGTKLWEDAKEHGALIVDDDSIIDLFYYRSSKGNLKSKEWTTPKLNDMIYDANIDLNFLNSPGLETEHERNALLNMTETILKFLPQHIIAHIMLAHLYKGNKEYKKTNYHYKKAKELFADKKLKATFQKYLNWDNKIIKSYLDYLKIEDGLYTSEPFTTDKTKKEKVGGNLPLLDVPV